MKICSGHVKNDNCCLFSICNGHHILCVAQYINKELDLIQIIFNSPFMSDEENFDKVDSGSADTTPTQAGSIKKGGYCMLKGFPCKVSDYSTAKPGKHGSAKATIVGNDIFTNKRYEEICPTSANIGVPNVTKQELEVADIDEEDFVHVILANGSLDNTLKLPVDDEDTYNDLKKVWDTRGDDTVLFTITSACGQRKFTAGRKK